jgi:hypothetical protein
MINEKTLQLAFAPPYESASSSEDNASSKLHKRVAREDAYGVQIGAKARAESPETSSASYVAQQNYPRPQQQPFKNATR